MSASWIQDRRRKQAAGYDEKTGAALADIMGGLEASLAVPETERKRKLAEEQAAEGLGVRKTAAEAMLLRAKTADKAAEESLLRKKGEESSRTARDEAKKAADDAKAKADGAKGAESVLRKRAASGADIETLIGAASADENLGEMDDDAVRGIQAEELAKKEGATAKVDADKALAGQRDAAAEKLLRKPAGGGGPKPLSEFQKLQIEEKRLAIAKLKREAEGGGPKDKVEAGTIKEVGELDATTRGIQDLERRNPGVGTGFFRAVQNSIAQTFGIDDPKATKYRADIANLSNEIISRLSGANVPPAEMERIAQGLPDFGDDDAAFTEKLRATKERVDRARKGLVGAAKAANRDTAGLEAVDPAGDVAAVPPAKKKATELTDEELLAEMAAEQ